jgi:hypothetical protein
LKFKQLSRVVAVTYVAVALGIGSFTPGALAGGTVSISSDTAVFLSGSGKQADVLNAAAASDQNCLERPDPFAAVYTEDP